MNEDWGNDVEQELQNELKRLKEIVDYLEQVKSTHSQSQQWLESAQKLFDDTTNSQGKLTKDIQKNVSGIEEYVSKQKLIIQQDIQRIETIEKSLNTETVKLQEQLNRNIQLFESAQKQFEEKTTELQKKIKQDVQMNRLFFLLLLSIIGLVFVIVK